MTTDSKDFNLDISTPVFQERDAEDVLTISQLIRTGFILLGLLFLSLGLNFYFALRKADLIVVDKSSGRTLAINNKDYGQTEAVSVAPDNLTDRDKKALVTEFLSCLYEVNGSTRAGQVNRLLKMLEPSLSLQQAQLFNSEKLLVREKTESVNSSWELQDLSIDERDPYLVRALGKRVLRRVNNGVNSTEETQIKVKFLLMDSPTSPARNDNNYRTGFYIQKYRAESVDGTRKSPLVLLSDERTSGNERTESSNENRSEVNAVTDKQ